MEKKRVIFPMPLVILALYSLFILVVVYILKNFPLIAAPIFFAVVVAYLFTPMVNWIERKTHTRRWLITAVLLILLIMAVTLILVHLIPYFIDQTRQAADKLPQFLEDLKTRAWRFSDYLSKKFPDYIGKFDLMKEIENSISNFFDHFSKFLVDAFSSIYSLVITLLYMILLPLFSYFFIKDSGKIRDSLISLFPSNQQWRVIEKGRQINQVLGLFVRGQAIIVLILIVLYSTGLLILDVPFALIIGIFAGLGDIIPYFGTIVGLIVSVLVSIIHFESPHKIILILALFAVVKGSENWFFYPKIVGREIGLHFLWVLSSLIFFGQLFGFWGLVVAIPSAATFKVFLGDLVQYYKHSDYFREH